MTTAAGGVASGKTMGILIPTIRKENSEIWLTFNPELEYKWSRTLSLAVGYHYEKWTIHDYNYNGFSSVVDIPAVFPFPQGVALLMGGLLPPGYHANVAYVRVKAGI